MASQAPTQRKRPVSPATSDVRKLGSGTCPRKRSYRPLIQPKLLDPAATSSPSRGLRDRVPQELIALLAKGSTADIPKGVLVADDDASEDTSIAPEHRLSLLIVQALTLARNYDNTFNTEHLAAQDMVMVDAFLRHSFYNTLRSGLVDEAHVPTEADYSEAHTFNSDLPQASDNFENEAKLLKLHERLITLIYNVQEHRNILGDLIMPNAFNPHKDSKQVVDILNHYSVTIARIELVCVTASTATSFGYTNLKHIGTASARLRRVNPGPASPAESLEIPTVAELYAVYSDAGARLNMHPPVDRQKG
ncbi:hypothetical protein COOONC_28330 [Cooperia oncophora]